METINIYNAYIKSGEFFFGTIGTIEYEGNTPKDIAECIWDLTNWSCWAGDRDSATIKSSGIEKNNITYYPNDNDRGFTNDDIMFCIDGKWWVAESFGWKDFDSFRDAAKYLIDNADWIRNKLDDLK